MANEKRLIDATDFIKTFWQRVHDGEIVTLMDVEHAIINAPTVEAVEVVHGHWIVDESGVIICSQCGAEHEWQDYRASFCEDCGAKMDGDGNG